MRCFESTFTSSFFALAFLLGNTFVQPTSSLTGFDSGTTSGRDSTETSSSCSSCASCDSWSRSADCGRFVGRVSFRRAANACARAPSSALHAALAAAAMLAAPLERQPRQHRVCQCCAAVACTLSVVAGRAHPLHPRRQNHRRRVRHCSSPCVLQKWRGLPWGSGADRGGYASAKRRYGEGSSQGTQS